MPATRVCLTDRVRCPLPLRAAASSPSSLDSRMFPPCLRHRGEEGEQQLALTTGSSIFARGQTIISSVRPWANRWSASAEARRRSGPGASCRTPEDDPAVRHVGLDLPHGGQRGLEPTRVLILLVKILSRVVLGGERVPAASRVPGRGPGSGVADADVSAVAAPGRSAPEAQCRASPRAAFLVEMAEQLTATVAGALLAALRAASGLERIAAGGPGGRQRAVRRRSASRRGGHRAGHDAPRPWSCSGPRRTGDGNGTHQSVCVAGFNPLRETPSRIARCEGGGS